MNERLYNDDLPQQIPPGWMPCFNQSGEVVPAFACMEFDNTISTFINSGTSSQTWAAQYPEPFNGQTVIRVRKPGGPGTGSEFVDSPGQWNYALYDVPSQFYWFNGPSPILPDRFGICTRLAPCRALVFNAGYNVGQGLCPVSRQWYLSSFPDDAQFRGVAPFAVLFYDPLNPLNLRRFDSADTQDPPWVAYVEPQGWLYPSDPEP